MSFVMSRRFSVYIGSLGVATLVALAWPSSVLFGFFLGVVPGVVLSLAPTLFLYSLLWCITRALLGKLLDRRSQSGAFRVVIAVLGSVIVAIPAVLIPSLSNMQAYDAAVRMQMDDFEPDKPIALPATIALVIDGNYEWSRKKPACETLCVRLLFNSMVARVIAVDPSRDNSTSAFWIERRETCPDRPNLKFDVTWMTDFPLVRGDTLNDRVRDRIAHGECLIEGDGRPEDAGATVAYRHVQRGTGTFQRPWHIPPGPPMVNRLEILSANGAPLYRRTEVTTIKMTTPLMVETRAGLLTTATYAGWARYEKTLGQIGPNGRDVLPYVFPDAAKKPEKRQK
jgi:hypothetical protein